MMKGYAKVARLMSTYEEFAILRRFKRLNYQNLLYLQAEMIHLEESLGRLVEKDAADSERKEYEEDWWKLAHGGTKSGRAQWKKVCCIREKLEQYNEALLQQVRISKLDEPNPTDLEFLRSWFERPSMGCFPIRGLDYKAWEQTFENDLVAIKPRVLPDPFSKWITDTLIPLYHRIFGVKFRTADATDLGDELYTYKESQIKVIIDIVTTVVAAVFPLLSIVVLYIVQSFSVRLGIVIVFSTFFALMLALMTNARRIEVFAATSA
ncbi:hypothetical protein F5Y02DRAFT_377510 [Annulohypoxylon stygium]|nr:hypothetical protein F5Y02DRAFT_377510 [Annulohypoxylon stygium]